MSVFFDTNNLVYLFDADAPEKQERARQVFASAASSGELVLSTQVLQEFFVTVTRKLAVPLSLDEAETAVTAFAEFPLVLVDEQLILKAIRRQRRDSLSFWDALIVESALESGASILLSEDMQQGRRFDGLVIENPFA